MEQLIDLASPSVCAVLPILLQDRTTEQNIIWATDTYEAYGKDYNSKAPVTSALITGENSSIIQPRIAKTVSDQVDRTKKHAEVFTPAWICNMMVNHCDEVWFGRKDVFNTSDGKEWMPTEAPIVFPKRKRWQTYVDSRRLEITCGEAPYLVSRYDASSGELLPIAQRIGILDRKLRVVNENAADEEEWLKYAFRALESVYGFEYQGDNLLIARINLLMTFMEAVQEKCQREATVSEVKRAANIISWNIWQMDGLKGTVPFGSLQEASTQLSIWDLLGEMIPAPEKNKRPECRIYDWRGQGKLKYNDRKTRKGSEMKFDFVIGNPPYQDETIGDNKGYAPPVYHKFLDSAYRVGDIIEMIHPARFLFNAGSTPKKWNEQMLQDPHLKVLYFEQDSSKVFANTDIKGGVVITHHDNKKDYGAIGIFTNFPELNSIVHRVNAHADSSIREIAYAAEVFRFTDKLHQDNPSVAALLSKGHKYDLKSNVLDKLNGVVFFEDHPADTNDYVRVLGLFDRKRTHMYIRKDYINNPENFGKWKVLLAKANGSGTLGEVLSSPMVIQPFVGHTQSFMSIGCFDTEEEANAVLKYLKCKFTRTLLGVLKITQDNPPEKWKYVPLQDFTPASDIDWSVSIAEIDRQLYKKYNLSEEEIAFIETKVKEMA